MSSVCTEPQLKFMSSFLNEVNIPPRKLLSRWENSEMSSESPRFDTLLQKFLPYNNGGKDDEEENDPYTSDHFRMYEFKVRRCTRSRSHDWTDCPFAHPGEKARRRDPRRFNYSGAVCPEFRRGACSGGACSRGDSCEFSHGVFECWLHPERYRTEPCKDGKNCKRKICFFAHSPRELRVVQGSSLEIPKNKINSLRSNHCCLFCHCGKSSSPTSTLYGMSENGFLPEFKKNEAMSYKEALNELMSSLESMNIDVSSLHSEDQLQFILSPSTPTFSGFSGENFSSNINTATRENKGNGDGDWSSGGPDFGWVNELLM